ncbi:unnamed protein product [Owenia fusiformis]|uniref:Uncharacterized protein n=1 Tax=Owenia fusiformis TaxID=6347 RepID=A0A8J1Y004_OWEFU|nr:unnamed protein product [Owenia fusiformis]
MMATRKVTVLRGICYIFAQCAGGIAGAGIVYGVTPDPQKENVGMPAIYHKLAIEQTCAIEAVAAFVVVFTIFASQRCKSTLPFSVGGAVFLVHLIAVPLTGCGLNPARVLGPAFVHHVWENQWIYWVSPIGGALVAGLMHEFIFEPYEPKKELYQPVSVAESRRISDGALVERNSNGYSHTHIEMTPSDTRHSAQHTSTNQASPPPQASADLQHPTTDQCRDDRQQQATGEIRQHDNTKERLKRKLTDIEKQECSTEIDRDVVTHVEDDGGRSGFDDVGAADDNDTDINSDILDINKNETQKDLNTGICSLTLA